MKKKEKEKAFNFLASFGLIFALLYLTSFAYLNFVEIVLAQTVLLLLSWGGQPGLILSAAEPVVVMLPSLQFQISFLCTGLIEFFVLTAAILASHGIERNKKWWGLIGAFDVVILFNLFRILTTINLLQSAPAEVADLAHDILFRLSLFVVIAGFYALWFFWATKKKR